MDNKALKAANDKYAGKLCMFCIKNVPYFHLDNFVKVKNIKWQSESEGKLHIYYGSILNKSQQNLDSTLLRFERDYNLLEDIPVQYKEGMVESLGSRKKSLLDQVGLLRKAVRELS